MHTGREYAVINTPAGSAWTAFVTAAQNTRGLVLRTVTTVELGAATQNLTLSIRENVSGAILIHFSGAATVPLLPLVVRAGVGLDYRAYIAGNALDDVTITWDYL